MIITEVARLNSSWRLVVVLPEGLTRQSWSLQFVTPAGWQGKGMTRSSALLREFVTAWCGPVDAGAAAILAALPNGFAKPRLPGKRRPKAAGAVKARPRKAAAVPPPAAPPPQAVKRETRPDSLSEYWRHHHGVRIDR